MSAKFSRRRGRPHHHFRTDRQVNKCLTTLSLTVFTQRNFVADFLQGKCDFTWKTAVLRFWAPSPLSMSAVYSPRVPACSTPYECWEVTASRTRLLCAGVAASDYSRLNSFLRRCIKLGYTSRYSSIIDIFHVRYLISWWVFCYKMFTIRFFLTILYNKTHVLHTYLYQSIQK